MRLRLRRFVLSDGRGGVIRGVSPNPTPTLTNPTQPFSNQTRRLGALCCSIIGVSTAIISWGRPERGVLTMGCVTCALVEDEQGDDRWRRGPSGMRWRISGGAWPG
jgi:hypothetical protein